MFPTRIERTGTAAAEVEAGAVLGASPATLAEQRRIRADRTYLLGAGLLAESLGVDTTYGLTDAQVNMRREEYGPNRLTEQRPRAGWKALGDQLRSSLFLILLAAAELAAVVELEPRDMATSAA